MCSTTQPIPSAKTAPSTSRTPPAGSACTSPGSGTWNQASRTYDRLAQRIANSGATAVYLGLDGVGSSNERALLRALRQRLGPEIELLTNWTAPSPSNPSSTTRDPLRTA